MLEKDRTKPSLDVYKELKVFKNVTFNQIIVSDLEKYRWCVCPLIQAETLVFGIY